MAIQWSTTVRNALLDAWEMAIGTSAIIRIYTGTVPANCAAAATGTKLIDLPLASDWAAAASGGAKNLNSVPLASTTLAGGTPGYYRIYAADGTTCHEQGSVTLSGLGGDMTLDNISLNASQGVNVTMFSKTAPGA